MSYDFLIPFSSINTVTATNVTNISNLSINENYYEQLIFQKDVTTATVLYNYTPIISTNNYFYNYKYLYLYFESPTLLSANEITYKIINTTTLATIYTRTLQSNIQNSNFLVFFETTLNKYYYFVFIKDLMFSYLLRYHGFEILVDSTTTEQERISYLIEPFNYSLPFYSNNFINLPFCT